MKEFIRFNPAFGRRTMVSALHNIVTNYSKPQTPHYNESYNTKHIAYDYSDAYQVVFMFNDAEDYDSEDEVENQNVRQDPESVPTGVQVHTHGIIINDVQVDHPMEEVDHPMEIDSGEEEDDDVIVILDVD